MAIDVINCINAGECIVLSATQYYASISVFVLSGVLLVMLFLVAFWTPALIFLKAKMSKKPMFYLTNRGQRGRFIVAKEAAEGVVDLPRVGVAMITENSHTIEKKSGNSLFFMFGEFGASLPLVYPYIIEKIRKGGHRCNNFTDLYRLVAEAIDEDDTDADLKRQLRAYNMRIRPYTTVKLHEMAFMFPFNVTPALVESRTQHLLAMKQALFNKLTPQMMMMFIMLLMGGTLAAVIAFKFLTSNTPPEVSVTVSKDLIETAAAGVATNLTG